MHQQRCIERMLRRNVSGRRIACALRRSISDVATEILLNTIGRREYDAMMADLRSQATSAAQHMTVSDRDPRLCQAIEDALKGGMTPSQIATSFLPDRSHLRQVSKSLIYRHIPKSARERSTRNFRCLSAATAISFAQLVPRKTRTVSRTNGHALRTHERSTGTSKQT